MPEHINPSVESKYREGQKGKNNKGTTVIIRKYTNSSNIIIEFQDEYKHQIITTYANFLTGRMKNPYDVIAGKHGFIGVGIYKPSYKHNGITIPEKSYQTWYKMHIRSENNCEYKPQYTDVKICKEWFNYQNFANWYNENYYEVENDFMCLDKDIMIPNSRIYSPETCCFLPNRLNEIFHNMNRTKSNGLPIGIEYAKRKTDKDGYRVKVTYVDDNGNRRYVRKTFDELEDAKKFYSWFKQQDTRRIIESYKNILPEKIYKALYDYNFSY